MAARRPLDAGIARHRGAKARRQLKRSYGSFGSRESRPDHAALRKGDTFESHTTRGRFSREGM